MAADRGHAQPAHVVQVPAIAAAVAAGSHRLKGDQPWLLPPGLITDIPSPLSTETAVRIRLNGAVHYLSRSPEALSATDSSVPEAQDCGLIRCSVSDQTDYDEPALGWHPDQELLHGQLSVRASVVEKTDAKCRR